jgi:hypothetical protein
MRFTLSNFGCKFIKIPLLYNNESAIKLANNHVNHSKGDIALSHVSTDKQLADIFTKPVDEQRFCTLRSELNILDFCNLV